MGKRMPDDKRSIRKNMKEFYAVDQAYPLNAKYPNNIMIELTNACNLKCNMCYNRHMKRKLDFISEELYDRIINEVTQLNIQNVGLYTVGESFLHPKIFDFIKTAKDKGMKYVYITTNGIALDKNKIEKIIDSGLDSIKFSIDASSKESYEKIRIGGSWDKLVDNIKYLNHLRTKENSRLKIFGSFTIQKNNSKDLFEYQSVFKGLIDDTLYGFVSNLGGYVEIESMFTEEIIKQLNNLMLPREKWHPCNLLWSRFIVTYNGLLTICCVDFEEKLIYGDLDKNTLGECWNNKKMLEFRKLHREKKFDLIPMCSDCDFVKIDEEALNGISTEIIKAMDDIKENS